MRLIDIANALDCHIVGNPEIEIRGVAGLEQAGPGEITFLSNPRYKRLLLKTAASAVIIEKEDPAVDAAQVISPNPYLDFARTLELYYQPPRPPEGLHPTAVVADSAEIGEGASIGPYSVIGEHAKLGKNAVLHSHVAIYEGAVIGDRFTAHSHAVVREFCEIGDGVILQNGAVVGGDGYGFAKQADGFHHKIVQAGKVVVEDDVEIQSHACIDRAAVGETRIKRGVKIDNLVQVGHAVTVGEASLLCAQAGIAGSTTVGHHCVLAGQVGLVNHITIGDEVLITAQSGVPNDVAGGQMISGYPAIENRRWLRCAAVYNRLPELNKTVKELQRRVDALHRERTSS